MVAKLPPVLPTIRASSSNAAANVMDYHHRNGDGIDRWLLRNNRLVHRNTGAIRNDLDSSAPVSRLLHSSPAPTVSDEQREPCDDENIDIIKMKMTKTIEVFAIEETRDDPIEIGSADAVMRDHDNKRRKRQHKHITVYNNIIKHHHYRSSKRAYPTSKAAAERREPYDMSSRSMSATMVEARDDAVHDHITNRFSINLFDNESFAPTGNVAIMSSTALMQHQPLHRCMDVMDVDHYDNDDDQESINDDSIITTTTVATTVTSSSLISSSSHPSRMSFDENIRDRRHTTPFESFMVMMQDDDRTTITTKINNVTIHVGNHQSNDDLPFEILCCNDSWNNHDDNREESHLSLDDDDEEEEEDN